MSDEVTRDKLESYFERKRKEWLKNPEFKAEYERFKAELEAEVKPPEGYRLATQPTIGDCTSSAVHCLAWHPDSGFKSLNKHETLRNGYRWLAFAPSKREEEWEAVANDHAGEVMSLRDKAKALETEFAARPALTLYSQRKRVAELESQVKALEAERDELQRQVWESRVLIEELKTGRDEWKARAEANSAKQPAPSNGVEWEEDKEGWFWWVERGKKMAVRHNGKWSWVSERTDSSSTEDVRVRPKGWRP